MPAAQIIGIVFIIVFSLLFCLTVHELGHFALAKTFRVNVREVAIGFGPTLWRTHTKKNHLRISIRLLPIGAYVLLDSQALRNAYVNEPNAKNYGFYMRTRPAGTHLLDQVSYSKQMLIMFAGIAFNLITFAFCFGLWSAIDQGAGLDLDGFIRNVFVGIGQAFVLARLHPTTGNLPPSGAEAFNVKVDVNFLLRYLLSINLATALLNILPVSPLDGWKIMQLTYEKCTKRKLPEKTMSILALIGAILLLWVTIGGIINLAV